MDNIKREFEVLPNYESPEIYVVDIRVESGFAVTGGVFGDIDPWFTPIAF